MKELKSDRATAERARLLAEELKRPLPSGEAALRKRLSAIGDEAFLQLMCLKEAGYGAGAEPCSGEALAARLANLRALREGILKRGDCLGLSDLAIGGADLLALGIPKGPALGDCLRTLLDYVLEDPARNKRALLLAYAKEKQNKNDRGQ